MTDPNSVEPSNEPNSMEGDWLTEEINDLVNLACRYPSFSESYKQGWPMAVSLEGSHNAFTIVGFSIYDHFKSVGDDENFFRCVKVLEELAERNNLDAQLQLIHFDLHCGIYGSYRKYFRFDKERLKRHCLMVMANNVGKGNIGYARELASENLQRIQNDHWDIKKLEITENLIDSGWDVEEYKSNFGSLSLYYHYQFNGSDWREKLARKIALVEKYARLGSVQCMCDMAWYHASADALGQAQFEFWKDEIRNSRWYRAGERHELLCEWDPKDKHKVLDDLDKYMADAQKEADRRKAEDERRRVAEASVLAEQTAYLAALSGATPPTPGSTDEASAVERGVKRGLAERNRLYESENKERKSVALQFVLSFLFGPLGLLYSNIGSAIGLSLGALLSIVILRGAAPFIWLVIWVISIVVGISSVKQHNTSHRQR